MLRVRLYLLAAITIWGWTFVATKICLAYLSPTELVALRLIIALPFLFFLLRLRRQPLSLERKYFKTIGISSFIFASHYLVQNAGVDYTTAVNSGWIISVTPLVMAVLSFFILGERLNRNEIFGIFVATAGLILLFSKGDLKTLGWLRSVGDWLVLASCFTWALYTISIRDLARAKDPMMVTFYVFLPCTLALFFYVLLTSNISSFFQLPLEAAIGLFYLGICGMGLAQWFWQEGVAKIGAARAGIYFYLEPLATTALAVPYLNEEFGFFSALGGALVLCGVWYSSKKKITPAA